MYEAVHGGELVGEVGVHIAQHIAVEVGGEADAKDENGEVPYHFHHLPATQLAVHLAFRVLLDLLTIGGVDAPVASPCRVAVDDEGEEAHCDEVYGWLDVSPEQADYCGNGSREVGNVVHNCVCVCVVVILNFILQR